VGGGVVIGASVRDLSTKGACIEVADPREVPADFFLMIEGLSERFRCHVVWKNGAILGVQYLYN